MAQLTTYMVPKPPEISLISGEDQMQVQSRVKVQAESETRVINKWVFKGVGRSFRRNTVKK